MEPTYNVILFDGRQLGPVDRDTLQLWLEEKRIQAKTELIEVETKKRLKCSDLFDIPIAMNEYPADATQSAALADEGDGAKEMSMVWGLSIASLAAGILCCFLPIGTGLFGYRYAAVAAQKGHPMAALGKFVNGACMICGSLIQVLTYVGFKLSR